MKQLTKHIFPLFLSFILMLSAGITALASGEGNGGALLPDGNGTADGALKSRWSDLQGDRRNILHHCTQYQRAVPPHEDASYGISKGALKT